MTLSSPHPSFFYVQDPGQNQTMMTQTPPTTVMQPDSSIEQTSSPLSVEEKAFIAHFYDPDTPTDIDTLMSKYDAYFANERDLIDIHGFISTLSSENALHLFGQYAQAAQAAGYPWYTGPPSSTTMDIIEKRRRHGQYPIEELAFIAMHLTRDLTVVAKNNRVTIHRLFDLQFSDSTSTKTGNYGKWVKTQAKLMEYYGLTQGYNALAKSKGFAWWSEPTVADFAGMRKAAKKRKYHEENRARKAMWNSAQSPETAG